MTQLEKDILDTISASKGIKARDIANKLNIDRHSVNSLLYGTLKTYCYQDSSYKWFVNKPIANSDNKLSIKLPEIDNRLASLCKYYLNCLSLEENNGISAFLKSTHDLDYTEIHGLGIDALTDTAVDLLKKTTKQRTLSAYIGYPVSIEKIHSTKNNEDYLKIAPVFLFAVNNNGGKTSVNTIPSVNVEVIKQYSSRDINSLVYDLVQLETDLGLNSSDADMEIDEMVSRLQAIRQWQWNENLDPKNIVSLPPIEELSEEGIYNRSIFIISERSHYTIGLESELTQLSNITSSSYKNTALYKWLYQEDVEISTIKESTNNLLEVLPLNSEQELAIRKSQVEELTIVTGPPGTGKSQVVTNLLVNMAWQGNNALFASKNNKAVDVVDNRVNSIGKKPIMMRIGGNQYVQLAELISGLLAFNSDESDRIEYEQYNKNYQKLTSINLEIKDKKSKSVSLRNQVDHIEQRFCMIREKYEKFLGKVNDDEVEELSRAIESFELGYNDSIKDKQHFFVRLFWFILKKKRTEKLGEKITLLNEYLNKFDQKKLPSHLNNLTEKEIQIIFDNVKEALEAFLTIIEYKNALNDLANSETIESIDKQLYNHKIKMAEIAKKLWDKWLITRPLNIDSKKRSEMNEYVSAIKLLGGIDLSNYPDERKKFNKLQKEMTYLFPCWSVTSLSTKGRIPFQPGIFDLVIIDEASQCDIASVIPLLYRAKRAVIIGDPKQLSHISTLSNSQDVNLLKKYNIEYKWSYSANSLYDLACGIAKPNNIIQLRDHHRSFKEIIEFSNQEFYDGKLRVATNYDRLNIPKNIQAGIKWIDVVGNTIKPTNGSAYNDYEIIGIINELRTLIENDYQGSIGVVTPFRAQANKIRESLEKEYNMKEYLYGKNDFLVDTVHKFQGDERDVMIFSPVISVGTKDSAISFLNNTGNLFNVAITRARSVLIIVGDKNYCANSSVSYLEHFVNYVNKHDDRIYEELHDSSEQIHKGNYPMVSNKDEVSEWERILYSALYNEGIITSPQYPVDKYKLDLALFSGNKKLDIEIDGEMYHKDWNGELCYRDQLRNHRLFELGWDVKRFWVYQVRDELQWCLAQIQAWVNLSNSESNDNQRSDNN